MASKKRPSTRRAKPRPAGVPRKPRRLSKLELLQSKVKSLEKQLRRYEKQRFVGPLKPGQKRRKVSKTEQEAIRGKLKLFLEGIKRNLSVSDIASNYRSHVNEDGSIDAEVRVPVEEDDDGFTPSVGTTLIDIEDAGSWNTLGEFWVMIGLSVSTDETTGSPTLDRRPQRPWSNPYRGNRAGAAFFTARETVIPKIEAWGANVKLIVIRILWKPENERPQRPRGGR